MPGLGFDAATRRLSGTPTRAGTYRMTYRADDDDANTGDSDAAIRTFTINRPGGGRTSLRACTEPSLRRPTRKGRRSSP